MFLASLKNELEKLFSRKKYIVFLILDAIGCLLLAIGQLVAKIVANGEFDTSILFDDMLTSSMSPFLTVFIPLMALLAAADLFSGEFHDLSIRMVLLRPVERWQIFCAKITAIFGLCVVFVFSHLVFSLLVKVLFSKTVSGAGYAIGAYLLDLVPMAVLVLLFAFLHQLVKSSGSAVALSVICYIALVILGKYVSFAGGLIFTEYLSWHSIWLGATLPVAVLLPKIGILLGTAIVFYCGGYYLFERKEI
jgi:ABC-2 type transport system permease protein